MKISLPCLLVVVALLATGSLRAEEDAAVVARAAALDVAGAFSNDGFKLRDGHWSGDVGTGAIVALNLYAGNQYWFAAALSGPGKPMIELFDETGKPVTGDAWKDGGRVALGVSATASGQYFLRIRMAEGAPSVFCVVYSYK